MIRLTNVDGIPLDLQSEHGCESPRSVVSLSLNCEPERKQNKPFFFVNHESTKEITEKYSGHFWVLNQVIETRVNLIRYRTHKPIEEEEATVYYQKNIFFFSFCSGRILYLLSKSFSFLLLE